MARAKCEATRPRKLPRRAGSGTRRSVRCLASLRSSRVRLSIWDLTYSRQCNTLRAQHGPIIDCPGLLSTLYTRDKVLRRGTGQSSKEGLPAAHGGATVTATHQTPLRTQPHRAPGAGHARRQEVCALAHTLKCTWLHTSSGYQHSRTIRYTVTIRSLYSTCRYGLC